MRVLDIITRSHVELPHSDIRSHIGKSEKKKKSNNENIIPNFERTKKVLNELHLHQRKSLTRLFSIKKGSIYYVLRCFALTASIGGAQFSCEYSVVFFSFE